MSQRAIAMVSELESNLKIRLSSLTITRSFDSSGNPTLKVGAAAAGAAGAFIRFKQMDWPNFKTSENGTARLYSPHVAQVAVEANPAGGAGADINTWATLLAILGEVIAKGTKVEVWEEANGTPPSVTTFDTASKLKASFSINLYQPMMTNA